MKEQLVHCTVLNFFYLHVYFRHVGKFDLKVMEKNGITNKLMKKINN